MDRYYRKQIVKTSGYLFCFLFNFRSLLRGKDVLFRYVGSGKYSVISKKYKRFFYSKSQNLFSFSNGISERAVVIGNDYMLDSINFLDGDVIIDCGANIGDLKLYFDESNIDIEYYGIEPSTHEFDCLSENVKPSNVFNYGLWNKNESLEFFVSSSNADSSFIKPKTYNDVIKIKGRRLDSFFDKTKKIKLLKLEAEGAEPEALVGCEKLLKNIEYISADLGFERGIREESTIEDVTNFLLSRNFRLVQFKLPRVVALFVNKDISLK